MLTVTTADAEATRTIGAALGVCLPPGALVTLSGGLGAGKTTFVQGVARGLGHAGRVTSPTYTLVHLYALPSPSLSTPQLTPAPTASAAHPSDGGHLVHVDLYRVGSAADVDELALDERRADGDRVVVEWPANAGAALGDVDLAVLIRDDDRDVGGEPEPAAEPPRVLALTAGTAAGEAVLACLARALAGRADGP